MPSKKRKALPTKSVGQATKKTKKLISVALEKPEEPEEPEEFQEVEESTSKSQAFPFLNLPPELRQMVYEAFFDLRIPRHHCCNNSSTKCSSRCPRNNDATSLRYVSRQIFSETWALFTEYHTFKIELDQLEDFLAAIRFGNHAPINHLTVWPSSTYWTEAEYKLEPIWWTYLDILSRLKTITFEVLDRDCLVSSAFILSHLLTSQGTLLAFLNNMLTQGAKRRSDWTKSNQALEVMISASQDTLPPSYNFELSLVQKKHIQKCKWWGGWMANYRSRYVIRQNLDPQYMESTKEFCKWRRDNGLMLSPPDLLGRVKHVKLAEYDDLQSLIPTHSSDMEFFDGVFDFRRFHEDAQRFMKERLDDFCTTHAERDGACITMGIGFTGRWINDSK